MVPPRFAAHIGSRDGVIHGFIPGVVGLVHHLDMSQILDAEGPFSIKYLRHIKVVDQPYHAWNEAMNHSIPRADVGGKSRWYHFQWAAKSVITRPSGGLKLARPGYVQITGLAWSGGGAVSKVDVSTDGGRSWKEAKLQAPVLPKAHTRFTFDWA